MQITSDGIQCIYMTNLWHKRSYFKEPTGRRDARYTMANKVK
jgi:hypothetical protein